MNNLWTFFIAIPAAERRITTATLITLFRLVLVPFIGLAIVKGWLLIALMLFLIAAVTDVLDGAIARYCKQETFLGRWLDALADRLLIVTSFSALLALPIVLPVPRWFLFFVLAREVLLLLGAWWFYRLHRHFSIEPVFLAKMSMALYVSTFLWTLGCKWLNYADHTISNILITFTVLCTVVSLLQQFYQGVKPMFRPSSKE